MYSYTPWLAQNLSETFQIQLSPWGDYGGGALDKKYGPQCLEVFLSTVIPFANTKRGTVQRGCKWIEIAEHLSNVQTPRCKVDQRGVRERYSLIAKTYRKKIREEERASGISTPEISELDQVLEEIVVREDEADRGIQEATAQKRKVKDDKKGAEEIGRAHV